MLPVYPKIFHLGEPRVEILKTLEVNIEEKIDGSQFGFGITVEGEVVMRSKGKMINEYDVQKLFAPAVEHVCSITPLLKEKYLGQQLYIYSETLHKPKHNVLAYEQVPAKHIMVYGVRLNGVWLTREQTTDVCSDLDLSQVPLLYSGLFPGIEVIEKMLDTTSILGSVKIEGVVIKARDKKMFFVDDEIPIQAKYVSKDFKEKAGVSWAKEHTTKGVLQDYIDSFKTEARWHKAIQHLNEQGVLLNEPKDIGPLVREIQRDLIDEEKENIKIDLYNIFKEQITKKSIVGFAEWYKFEYLMNLDSEV